MCDERLHGIGMKTFIITHFHFILYFSPSGLSTLKLVNKGNTLSLIRLDF